MIDSEGELISCLSFLFTTDKVIKLKPISTFFAVRLRVQFVSISFAD